LDALARIPGDAVRILRAWELSPPDRLAAAPGPIPERAAFAHRSHALVGAVIEAGTTRDTATPVLAEELHRVLQIVEGALLVQESAVIEEYVQWLRVTGPSHGFALADIDTALAALADGMDGDLRRAGIALRGCLN
jgi:hypothetical protein